MQTKKDNDPYDFDGAARVMLGEVRGKLENRKQLLELFKRYLKIVYKVGFQNGKTLR